MSGASLLMVSSTCIVILLFVVASLQPLGGGGIRVRRFSGSHALLPMEPELILALIMARDKSNTGALRCNRAICVFKPWCVFGNEIQSDRMRRNTWLVYWKPPSTIREAPYRLWLVRFAQSRLGEYQRPNEVGCGFEPG